MQEFLSGTIFEQMAREYNEKYNKANVLNNGQEYTLNKNCDLTEDKERNIKMLEKDFNNIFSLFLFIRKHITRIGLSNCNMWGEFYYAKLNELENKIEKIRQEVFNLIHNS